MRLESKYKLNSLYKNLASLFDSTITQIDFSEVENILHRWCAFLWSIFLIISW